MVTKMEIVVIIALKKFIFLSRILEINDTAYDCDTHLQISFDVKRRQHEHTQSTYRHVWQFLPTYSIYKALFDPGL